jgi:hypothetical protein
MTFMTNEKSYEGREGSALERRRGTDEFDRKRSLEAAPAQLDAREMGVLTLEHVVCGLLPRLQAGRALAPREWSTLARVAEVLLSGAPYAIPAADVANNIEKFLLVGRSRRAWRVRVLLHLIELHPLRTHGRTFSRLAVAERRRFIEEKWVVGGPIGRICARVKGLVLLGAYGDARVGARVGYVPVTERRRLRPILKRMPHGARS